MIDLKKLTVATSILGLTLVSVSPAFAQDATLHPKAENRCKAVAAKVTNVLVKHDLAGGKVKNAFHEAGRRLEVHEARLHETLQESNPEAYDTLKEYIAVFKDKIAKLPTDIETAHSSLVSVQSLARDGKCASSHEEFKDAMEQVRSDRHQLRLDVQDAKNYWTETIKPYILSLKAQ